MTNMVVGIKAITSYIPKARKSLSACLSEYHVTQEFLEKKTGYLNLARKSKEESTLDLAFNAFNKLLEQHPNLRNEIGLIVVITQNPGPTIPHISALLHGKAQLPQSVAAFDISLGCSGWVYGLSIVKSFMEANGILSGVLITADPYSDIIDSQDRNTSLIFGDAATATLFGHKEIVWDIGKFVFGTDGEFAKDLCIGTNGKLHMNGRSIFNFSLTKVPLCVKQTIENNGLELAQIDRIILHQAGRYMVESIGERLGCKDKTPFFANDVGNTVSSSIPLFLSANLDPKDANIITACFGVGLSWAATFLQKR
ncbi:ketoacyl-ACP synthase III [soil metagenome]